MGDIMRYSGGDKEDFRGVIIEVDDGAMYENKYTAVDVGWYLNKTTDISVYIYESRRLYKENMQRFIHSDCAYSRIEYAYNANIYR